jgi:hypothetical protein
MPAARRNAASANSAPAKLRSARPALTIVDAIDDEALFQPWFPGSSWDGWRTILKAAFAIPLNEAELQFFHSVAGDRDPPKIQVRELWLVCGRRAGKDSIASVIAAFAAAMFAGQARLRPGERALLMCLACDRDQSRIVLNYTRSYFLTSRCWRP